MIEKIVRSAAARPFLAVALALAAAVFGAIAFRELPRDVFPDLSAPVFNVIVQNPTMAAEELESSLSIPMETALAGLPGARRVRSLNQLGVSQISVEFEPEADYQRSRQLVAERVQEATARLPPGTEPPLISSLTGRLNEVMELSLEAEPGKADLMTLRDLAEFELRNRLLAVSGVSAVERLGGYLRQFQVQIDPDRMVARGVSLDDVLHAVEGANRDASAGFITQGPIEWSVRAIGRATTPEELRSTAVTQRGHIPVLLGDVAEVREAPAVRRGIAHGLSGEIVSLRIVKQFGADTVKVSEGVHGALGEMRRGLPPGVTLNVSYDQADLVQGALGGVGRAVLIGAALVVLVLFGLLGNLRAALLVTLTIPLSIASAGILLRWFGVGLNTMTLGGLAIAVGLLVDASIIVVENVVHRISGTVDAPSRKRAAVAAAVEVGRPIAFATLLVAAVFLPLFGMSGIEGRMYRPLSASVVLSMLAALTLALTLTPALSALVLRPRAPGKSDDVWLVRQIKRVYAPVLDACLARAGLVRAASLLLTVPAIVLGLRIGSDFMPELDEGALILNTIIPPEASLEEVDRLNHRVEDVLREFPEVREVVRRTGRSERTEDPMAHTYSDVLVVLHADRKRSLEELVSAMRRRTERVPGVSVLFTTPLGMRIDEGLGGTPADIAIKIFGPDLDELERLAERVEQLVSKVSGIADLRAERAARLPELRVTIDRKAVANVGLTPAEVIRALSVGLVGEKLGEIRLGQRRFDLVVRLDDRFRSDPSALRRILVDAHDGSQIPLGQLATLEETTGPGAIRREAQSRRVTVEAAVAGRDLSSVAREIRELLARELPPKAGYFVEVGGRVESQERAQRSLLLAIGLAVLSVLVLLYLALGSWAETLVIVATLPDALAGGIVALWLSGETWNVSSLVGLIGLFGIAVQNGLVLVLQTRAAAASGQPFEVALREACIGRVRPKLMTAATAILGLLPFVVLGFQGTEIERPLAIVMIGGLITSTAFTLLALPTFYTLVHSLGQRLRGASNETPRPA
jgi:heavy metal efflux system protein